MKRLVELLSRIPRRAFIGGFLLLVVGGFVGGQLAASAEDANATAIQTQLESFGTNLLGKTGTPVDADQTDYLYQLTQSLPFTDVNPVGPDGLDVQAIVHDAVASATGLTSVSDLASKLDSVNTTFDGVNVKLGRGGGSTGTAVTISNTGTDAAPVYQLVLPIDATRTVAVPLALPTSAGDLSSPDGKNIGIDLELSGTLTFGYQPDAAAGSQFYLLSPNSSPASLAFTASVDTSAATATYGADLGFTKVQATADLTQADANISITFASPHGAGDANQGRITSYDWANTALQDLVRVDASGSASADVSLDSTLISGTPDVKFKVSGSYAKGTGFTPSFQLYDSSNTLVGSPGASLKSLISGDSLSEFLNVTPSQVLSGLGQFASTLQSLQSRVDVHLPFLQSGVASKLDMVTKLAAMLGQQTVACGTSDGTQPSGSLLGLDAGTEIFCRATTTDTVKSGSIVWTAIGGTAMAGSVADGVTYPTDNAQGADADGTISSAPTKSAIFVTTTDNVPPVIGANYVVTTSTGDVTKGVSQPIPNAQDLFSALEDAAGFDKTAPSDADGYGHHSAPGLSYDSSTKTLTFHLIKSFAIPTGSGETVSGSFDFGDRLKDSTGLFGLSPDSGASVSLTPGKAVLDITFGVILAPDLSSISTASSPPSFLDRFFVKASDDGNGGTAPLIAIEDATANATIKLAGQVGFLGITAAGESDACDTSQSFCLHRADTSKPMLGLDLVSTTTDSGDASNGDAPSGLDVGSSSVDGAITIPELLHHLTTHLAIAPNVEVSGGLAIKATVPGVTAPLASGNVGFDWKVQSMSDLLSPTVTTDSLDDTHNLAVHADANFSDSLKKFWEMAKNDPTALLRVVLDSLRDLADKASASNSAVLDEQLPLVSTTPRHLMTQFTRLKSAIDELTGSGNTKIDCLVGDTSHSTATADAAVASDTIDCSATYPVAAQNVNWTVDEVVTNNTSTALTIDGNSVQPGASVAVPVDTSYLTAHGGSTADVGNTVDPSSPTAVAEFTLPTPTAGNFTGYQVHLTFDDENGSHSAALPQQAAPSTLQGFRDWLTAKLGLPDDVLILKLIDTPKPGGSTPVKTLELGLKYDVCTEDYTGCDTGAATVVPKLRLPLNLDLGDLGSGLAPSLQTTGSVTLGFLAHAQLDVGIPLDGIMPTSTSNSGSSGASSGTSATTCSGSCDDTGLFEILGGTQAYVEAQADNSDDPIGGKASMGPLSLTFGSSSPVRDAPSEDTTDQVNVGRVHLGGRVTFGVPGQASDSTTAYTLSQYADNFAVGWDKTSGDSSSCGKYDADWSDWNNAGAAAPADAVDPKPTSDPTEEADVSGVACGLFTLGLNGTYLGDVGFSWTGFDGSAAPGSSSFTVYVNKTKIVDKIKSAIFDPNFLLKALPPLLQDLQDQLSNAGGTGNNKLPVIGNALDAGADVVGKIHDGVDTVVNGFDQYVSPDSDPLSNPQDLTEKADRFLFLQFASKAQVDATGIDFSVAPYSNWPQAELGLLQNSHGGSDVTPADIGLVLRCDNGSGGTVDCSNSTDAADFTKISDASVDMTIGQGVPTTGDLSDCATGTSCFGHYNIPFDIGMDGLPLRISGALAPNVGWKARLNFGMSRALGPYLVVDHGAGSTPAKDLEIGASVGLGVPDSPSATCTDADKAAQNSYIGTLAARTPQSGYPSAFPFSKNDGSDTTDNAAWKHCLSGTLGFLQVNALDTNGADDSKGIHHTGIALDAGLSFVKKGATAYTAAGDKLGLKDITSLRVQLGINATADANLLLHAGVNDPTKPGFPSIYGVLHAHWEWGTTIGGSGAGVAPSTGGPSALSISQVYMDAGEFLKSYLQPIVRQVKSVTSPFKPILDALYTPIPVVSQLAALVGQPPVTLIDLAQALAGNDLTMIRTIIDVVHFANEFDASGDSVLIPMGADSDATHFLGGGGGYFGINTTLAKTPQTQASAGQLVANPVATKAGSGGSGGLADTVSSSSAGTQLPADAQGASKNGIVTDPIDGTTRFKTFGVAGLDIPLMRDPSLAFQLLMGQDITLVDYQFGGLHAQVGFTYTFGPFLVGPVPVAITIGGQVGVNGHLGIGYDTTGLREVIGGGSPYKLLDGLYFDTYDASGHATPVIQLVGTVTAGAEVDLGIIKAGIEAGLQLTVNFLWDDPTPDGKMSFQDIANKISNPVCLFRVSGSLDAFLRAFVEFDFLFVTERYSFTILKLHLLDFSAACSPPSPEPATQSGDTLLLNIGPRHSERNINTDAKDESITVRQLPPPANGGDGHQVGVTIFGAYKEYGDYATSSIKKISANGDDGDDDIELLPGSATAGTGTRADSGGSGTCSTDHPCVVPFTIPGDISGGTGNDTIIGGDGADALTGGGDSDSVTGNAGDDLLGGGGASDHLDGGVGADKLCSGSWSSSTYSTATCTVSDGPVVESGGPGNDTLYGSNAADELDGGPGLDPSAVDPGSSTHQTFGQESDKSSLIDGDDNIYGYIGDDSINGGPGNDVISGDNSALVGDWSCTQGGTAPDATTDPPQTDNDTIDAGSGNDRVWAGPGDDSIKTQTGDGSDSGYDFACGGSGNDTLEGAPAAAHPGDDTLLGGDDNDVVTGGAGNNFINGGGGNDGLTGGGGNNDIIGGNGRDWILGGNGNDIVIGDAGSVTGDYNTSTTVTGQSSVSGTRSGGTALETAATSVGDNGDTDAIDCTGHYDQTNTTTGSADCITGGPGDDAEWGGAGGDVMTGDAGNDYLSGGSGADFVHGGLGNDDAHGGAGNDQMWGDSGTDSMYGDANTDTMHGGPDADYMEGDAGTDTMFGDENNDHMLGGSSTAGTPDAEDSMSGGAGRDTMVGDNGSITGDDAVVVFDSCSSSIGGGDTMAGDDGDDWMFGGPGGDTMNGNTGLDYMEGNAGADTIHGDEQDDQILGGSSSDTATDGGAAQSYTLACDAGDTSITGDTGDDVILGDNGIIHANGTATMASSAAGTYGDDTIRGGNGQDRMYGELGADTMTGDANEDYILGDLGAITTANPAPAPATWPGGAPIHDVTLVAANAGGADAVYGGGADDHVYGGAGDDTLQGGAGDDYIEGNGGQDNMYGSNDNVDGASCNVAVSSFDCGQAADAQSDNSSDQDDMIGGSSGTNPDANQLDAGENVMNGNGGQDVILGDNGTITRTVNGDAWAVDPITTGAARAVTLTYQNASDCSTADGDVCGGDTVNGNGGNDRIYGEGGTDTIHGNGNDDYIEGNQASDHAHGDAGDDDLIGGSSHVDSGSGDSRVGEPDSGDYLYGDDGNDVVTGDNAVVTKTTPTQANANPVGDEITQGLKSGTTVIRQRTFTLLDLGTSTVGTYGGDTIDGGSNVDVIFGQAGSDTITGDGAAAAPDDDYIEGNQGADAISGNAGQDDIIGGSSHIMTGTLTAQTAAGEPDDVDTIHGNAGSDVVLGDNGRLLRIGTASAGTWTGKLEDSTKRAGMTTRAIDLYDLGESLAAANSGGDTITGDDGTASSGSADVILGQGGDDTIDANAGNDYVEGNQGADSILGQDGTDDLIGGSSTAEPTAGIGQPDAGDDITGGSGDDVVLGDNGSIDLLGVRPLTSAASSSSYSGYVDDALKNRDMTLRRVDLLDLGDTPVDGHSGADDILGDDATSGGGAADVLLGQTGNDRIRAGDGDDYVEGGAGRDWIEGNANDDDLIGGSSTRLDNSTTPPTGAKSGQPDDADAIYGGGGDDLTAADNAVISRLKPFAVNPLGGKSTSFLANLIGSDGRTVVTQRSLQLLDLENAGSSTTTTLNAPDSKRLGGDDVSGGQGVDVVFGQDGDDSISGGPNDDYIEGNGGNDTIRGDLLLSDTAPTDADAHGHRHGAVETPATSVSPTAWQLGLAADAAGADLEGAVAGDGTDAGQDDLIGGSSRAAFRDGNDSIEGDGGADAVQGDNGDLVRTMNGTAHSQSYLLYAKRYSGTPAGAEIVRHKDGVIGDTTTRFCTAVGSGFTATCEVAAASGADTLYGDTGDDTMWGQDGNDYLRGGDGNDDMYGEQGSDTLYGDNGEDAMLGDRGGVVDTYISGSPGGTSTNAAFKTFTLTVPAPPKTTFTGFVAGTVDRRTDLQHDVDGTSFAASGTTRTLMPVDGANFGGDDTMFGGDGRDSMHGGYGDDVMNGDSGGDTLFGDRGGDVLWGGKGCDPDTHSEDYINGCDDYSPTDLPAQGMNSRNSKVILPDSAATTSNPQTFTLTDGNVDYLFGGRGAPGSDTSAQSGASGADIMDWRPRGDVSSPGTSCASGPWPAQSANGAAVDPCSWFDDTNLDNDQSGANPGQGGTQDNQHHEGIDWMYGGWDRDVMQADVANNGPNQGDWQADWTGVYNLWTHCNSAYGGFNDIYQLSPTWQSFLQQWAYALGAGQGAADVTSSGSSAFEELALVYTGDIKSNGSGSPYPGTPGHFDNPNACGL